MNFPTAGLENIIDNEDFYSLLNVRRDATQDQLKASYHKLCVIYHPDKQDEGNQKNASDIFAKLQEAYSVLSDPTKRHIYDVYGKQGLEAEWQLVERQKTPQEFQVEYERIQRMRAQQLLEELTHPEGSFKVGVNATSLFDEQYAPEGDEYYDDIIMLPEISHMSIQQSVQAPLTLSTTAKLSGGIQSSNGNGSGNCSFVLKKTYSPKSWGEFECGATDTRTLNLAFKGYRSFSHGIFGVARIPFHFGFDGNAITVEVPNTNLSVGRMMSERLYGSMDLTTTRGFRSNLASSLIYNHPQFRVAGKMQFGIPHSYGLMSFSYKLPHDSSVDCTVKAGTFGLVVQYGAEHQVSEHSAVSAQVSVGVPVGVTLTLKLTRASHTYAMPIMLSDELNLAATFYGTVIPVALYTAVQLLVIKPYQNREKERKAMEDEEMLANEIHKKKKEAQSLISMMKETATRKIFQEKRKRGLVIVEAWYGSFVTHQSSVITQTKVCEVTVPLQTLVESSKLQLPPGITKSGIPGFYDPCPASEKKLKVTYKFHGKTHRVVVDDQEPLRMPLKSHLVEDSEEDEQSTV